MKIKYNVTGAKRRELVQIIAYFMGCQEKYKGAPTFAYEVDYFTIDKNGTLIFDEELHIGEPKRIIELLKLNGFEAEENENSDIEDARNEMSQRNSLILHIPLTAITETAELGTVLSNLEAIIASKHELFKKAIGTDREFTVTADEEQNICFDWFTVSPDTEQAQIYTTFVSALC